MSDETSRESDSAAEEFARQSERRSTGFVREFYDFLRHNKKWWLAPIIVVLLIVGLIIIIGGSAAAPFIYTLF